MNQRDLVLAGLAGERVKQGSNPKAEVNKAPGSSDEKSEPPIGSLSAGEPRTPQEARGEGGGRSSSKFDEGSGSDEAKWNYANNRDGEVYVPPSANDPYPSSTGRVE